MEQKMMPDAGNTDFEKDLEEAVAEATAEELEASLAGDKPMTRLEAYRRMSDEELEEELAGVENYRGDMTRAIRNGGDAEEVAAIVESWFCPKPNACEDASRSCLDCIEAWLEEPYPKAKEE